MVLSLSLSLALICRSYDKSISIHPLYKTQHLGVEEWFVGTYSLPSITVNPQEWIKVNIYRGVNS